MLFMSGQHGMEAHNEYSHTRAYRRYVYASAGIAFSHEGFPHGPLFSTLTRLNAGLRQAAPVRWSVPFLVCQAVPMAYDSSATLQDRVTQVRQTLIEMFPSRRRPGRTYQGFIKALKQLPSTLVDRLEVAEPVPRGGNAGIALGARRLIAAGVDGCGIAGGRGARSAATERGHGIARGSAFDADTSHMALPR